MQTTATWSEVKKELISIAAALDVPITAERVQWYVAILEHLGPTEAFMRLRRYGMTTRSRRLPLPSEILADMDGEIASAMVVEAIRKFGYSNPKEAREFLGPAWKLVELNGGWQHLCENLTHKTQGTFVAQARDLWTSLQRSDLNGTCRQQIGNSEPKSLHPRTAGLVDNALRRIPEPQGPHKFDGSKDFTD